MGPDAAHLAASVAKSVEVDKSPGVNSRTSEIAQEQLAGEAVSALMRKKTDAADSIRRNSIRREHERRRREMEGQCLRGNGELPEDGGIDLVA